MTPLCTKTQPLSSFPHFSLSHTHSPRGTDWKPPRLPSAWTPADYTHWHSCFSAGLVTVNQKNQKIFFFPQKTHQIASNHAAVSPHCTGISQNPQISTLTKKKKKKTGKVCRVYPQSQTDHEQNSDTTHFYHHVTHLNSSFQ